MTNRLAPYKSAVCKIWLQIWILWNALGWIHERKAVTVNVGLPSEIATNLLRLVMLLTDFPFPLIVWTSAACLSHYLCASFFLAHISGFLSLWPDHLSSSCRESETFGWKKCHYTCRNILHEIPLADWTTHFTALLNERKHDIIFCPT